MLKVEELGRSLRSKYLPRQPRGVGKSRQWQPDTSTAKHGLAAPRPAMVYCNSQGFVRLFNNPNLRARHRWALRTRLSAHGLMPKQLGSLALDGRHVPKEEGL